MRRVPPAVALTLIAAIAACGGDGGAADFDIADSRVVIVSGDHQTGPVKSPDAAGAVLPVDLLTPTADVPAGVLSQPLVVRIDDESGPAASITGPISPAVVPAGTPTYWRRPEGFDGCSVPFAGEVATDDSAYAVNYVVRGTRAGIECPIEVGRLVRDPDTDQVVPVIDSVFYHVLEPGPVVTGFTGPGMHFADPDTLRMYHKHLADAWGNHVPWRFETNCCAHPVATALEDSIWSRVLIADSVGQGTFDILTAAGVHASGILTVTERDGGLRIAIEIPFQQ